MTETWECRRRFGGLKKNHECQDIKIKINIHIINFSGIIVPLQMKVDFREQNFLFRRQRIDLVAGLAGLQVNTQVS